MSFVTRMLNVTAHLNI